MIVNLVDWALSPLNWLLIAMLLAIAGMRLRARRWLVGLAIGLAVTAFAVATPVVSNTLARRLERAIVAPAWCQTSPPDVVVVLAAGVDRLPRWEHSFQVLSATSRRRIDRGIEYWRQQPGRSIVMAGGPTASGWIPHAALMSNYAQQFGVPADVITLEAKSLNTWQNAHNVAALEPALPRRIALATSAMHMRRSVLAFRAAGFEVCPLPTDRRSIRASLPAGLVPDITGLQKADAALHEMVGNLHYEWLRWRSRSAG
ncbi:YdcF family protein [Lysobacter korlensis]|uniref:YdcF family protein n=1 Tax=Lysobacter korlensis TaxID=553636 RepID=A0ABV6RLD9_9GAMM